MSMMFRFDFFSSLNKVLTSTRTFIRVLIILPALAESQAPPEIQLANSYHPEIKLEDYWLSEKLDGVRAYWNGEKLISKQGLVYQAPAWFTENFPDFALDGELWIARNHFDVLSGIVRKRQPVDAEWRQVTYQIFDLPKHSGVFNVRLGFLRDYFKASEGPLWLKLIEQTKVTDHQTLMTLLDEAVAQGAEGLMLHLGSSYYHNKRNNDLLKVKRYFDAEAKVIGHISGKGKYRTMLGSVLVEALNKAQKGKRFKLGSGFSDERRKHPPPVGSVITYKYFGLTNKGLPRFASFMRVREGF